MWFRSVAVTEYAPLTAVMKDEKGNDPLSLAMKELRADTADVLSGIEKEPYVVLEIKTESRFSKVLPNSN